MRSSILILIFASLFAMACGPDFLRSDADPYEGQEGFKIDGEAEIADTVEHREVLDVLIQYRRALVQKDVGSLQRLVSEDYYENASTTDTTKDDYGAGELPSVFELVSNHIDDIKYDVTVKELKVDGQLASVDYEYQYAYHYKIGEQVSWDAGVELNRLELEARDGEWKIVSGL